MSLNYVNEREGNVKADLFQQTEVGENKSAETNSLKTTTLLTETENKNGFSEFDMLSEGLW